jgi:hypothetical protein
LSEMIRGSSAGMFFQGALEDDLDVSLGHGLAQFPVNDGARATLEQRAEIEEGAGDVDVADIATCQCSWGASGCTKPVPFSEGLGFQESSSPAP